MIYHYIWRNYNLQFYNSISIISKLLPIRVDDCPINITIYIYIYTHTHIMSCPNKNWLWFFVGFKSNCYRNCVHQVRWIAHRRSSDRAQWATPFRVLAESGRVLQCLGRWKLHKWNHHRSEIGHRNSEFFHKTWWSDIVMLVYQYQLGYARLSRGVFRFSSLSTCARRPRVIFALLVIPCSGFLWAFFDQLLAVLSSHMSR